MECISWTNRDLYEGTLLETWAIRQGTLLETWAIRQYVFMAFASSYVQPENSSVYKYETGGKKEMYMNLLHPLCRFEQRSFSSSVSCSKELTWRYWK